MNESTVGYVCVNFQLQKLQQAASSSLTWQYGNTIHVKCI